MQFRGHVLAIRYSPARCTGTPSPPPRHEPAHPPAPDHAVRPGLRDLGRARQPQPALHHALGAHPARGRGALPGLPPLHRRGRGGLRQHRLRHPAGLPQPAAQRGAEAPGAADQGPGPGPRLRAAAQADGLSRPACAPLLARREAAQHARAGAVCQRRLRRGRAAARERARVDRRRRRLRLAGGHEPARPRIPGARWRWTWKARGRRRQD